MKLIIDFESKDARYTLKIDLSDTDDDIKRMVNQALADIRQHESHN